LVVDNNPAGSSESLGDGTQLDVGARVHVGAVSEVVIVELSGNPSDPVPVEPTPKNNRSVVPS
jgi:hypothetical protein